MKIRNGFVSNSSSSSFILKLPFIPTCKDDIRKMLLVNSDAIVVCSEDCVAFPANMVIDTIYEDIMNELEKSNSNKIELKPMLDEEIYICEYTINDFDHLINTKYLDEYRKLKRLFKLKNKDNDDRERELEKTGLKYHEIYVEMSDERRELDNIGDKIKNVIMSSIKDNSTEKETIITLSYSDEDGDLHSFIEHGGILNPICLTRISHH